MCENKASIEKRLQSDCERGLVRGAHQTRAEHKGMENCSKDTPQTLQALDSALARNVLSCNALEAASSILRGCGIVITSCDACSDATRCSGKARGAEGESRRRSRDPEARSAASCCGCTGGRVAQRPVSVNVA